MDPRNRAIVEGAALVSRESGADAVLLAAALPDETEYLRARVGHACRVIAATRADLDVGVARDREAIVLPQVRLRRRGRAKIALLESLAAGLLRPGERVIVVSGSGVENDAELDTVALVDLSRDEEFLDGEADAPLSVLSEVADPAAFDALLGLCVELGHEGKEGRHVGVLATLGDEEAVLARSHPIVLNPFEGHDETDRSVLNPHTRRALREFAGMDGAVVVRRDGVVLAAGRYLQDLAPPHAVPPGLGARHRAAAGITGATRCIAFTVSESTGDTRVFLGGRVVMTIERAD